ncbi:MAG: chromosomal replication initiator DnaA [Rhodobacteraceae bacterium]|nr:chromosomal replication initiator DnaA [Paracoccaceae bacterium]
MKRPEQFTLPLPQARPAATGRADFFVSAANAAALAAVDGWQDWPQGKLVLVGPPGAGKSHLARIWAAETDAALLPAADLPAADLPALAATGRVALDDAHHVAGDAAAERALFHLHNMLAAAGGQLLLTATEAPNRWPVALPDLASRLQAAPVARLDRPDDALLAAVLVKLFADRQLHVAPAVIAYLATRIDRSLAAAAGVVVAIDRQSLTTRREITRAFAAEVLDTLTEAGH